MPHGYLQWMMSTGYRSASVIIALTDGELHEDLFYYAEREVGEVKNSSTNYYHLKLVDDHMMDKIKHCHLTFHSSLFI